MRGKRVGVEKVGKSTASRSLIAMPEDASSIGFIRYVGKDLIDTDLQVGAKVVFGDKRHQVKINGADIMVMDEDNVYATVEDESSASK